MISKKKKWWKWNNSELIYYLIIKKMKTYKLLKKIPWLDIGTIFTYKEKAWLWYIEDKQETFNVNYEEISIEWFEEIIEEKFIPQWSWKPKFKVKDRVNMGTYYWTVIGVDIKPKTSELDEYIYYLSWLNEYEWEENLRTPTDEEVDIYY